MEKPSVTCVIQVVWWRLRLPHRMRTQLMKLVRTLPLHFSPNIANYKMPPAWCRRLKCVAKLLNVLLFWSAWTGGCDPLRVDWSIEILFIRRDQYKLYDYGCFIHANFPAEKYNEVSSKHRLINSKSFICCLHMSILGGLRRQLICYQPTNTSQTASKLIDAPAMYVNGEHYVDMQVHILLAFINIKHTMITYQCWTNNTFLVLRWMWHFEKKNLISNT